MTPAVESKPIVIVRPAIAADLGLMVRWAEAMAFETEHKALDTDTVSRGIERGLADLTRARYFMAEIAGEPAGTLMLTPEWSDWRNAWWWWVQSVYVTPDHRRKGVYGAMYHHVRALAEADGNVFGLRLYVERDNAAAQRTYEFFGMRDAGYRMYEDAVTPRKR